MNILNFRKFLISTGVLITTFVLAFAPQAFAQEQDDAADEEEVIEEIITTGSRIKRAGIDTFYPAVLIQTQELEDGAFTNLADALNQIPSFGVPDAEPFGAQNAFSTGQNFVDFLGLGSQRTLTLVDGRRFVSSNTPVLFGETGGLQVDYNVIPLALIDRIETISVGGAPIYGSDAIAGTINVILKDRFEGLEINARSGQTSDSDASFTEFSIVAGANLSDGRGNVTMSMEAFSQDGLALNARPRYTANNPYFASVEGDGFRRIYYDQHVQLFSEGGAISPGGLFIPNFGPGAGVGDLADGVFYQFDQNSNLVPFIGGQSCPGSIFFACRGQDPNGPDHDGPDFFDNVAQIQSPLDRYVFTSAVNYDIGPDITFFADVLYSKTWADELVNQGGFQTFAFSGTSGALTYQDDDPFLPQQARDLLATNGLTTFTLHRFNNDIIDSSNERKQNLWRASAGVEGSFTAGNRDFYWDIYGAYGESDSETNAEGIVDGRFLNAIDVRQLTAADLLLASEAEILAFSGTATAGVGDLVCEDVFQAALGNISDENDVSGSGVTDEDLPFVQDCVPLNLFGLGARSLAARDWVTADRITLAESTQSVLNANFGGDAFELPGGWVGFNVGFEAREETAVFIPSLGTEVPFTRSSPFNLTGGEYDTTEWYGELVIPLVSSDMDLSFLELAEINAAVREIDNSLAGNATVWTIGGRIAPVRDITFRGNYTESLRAPSLAELFAPQNQVFGFADDPCDNRFVNSGPAAGTRLANCITDLGPGYDPATFTSNIVNATAIGTSGGNPNLANETAESFSAGFTFEPRWVEGLLLTVDYIDIELTDAIVELSTEQLMRSCYDSVVFPAPPLADGTVPCDSFVRDANFQVIDFSQGQANASLFDYASVQYGASYNFELANLFGLVSENWGARDLGDFDFRMRLENLKTRRVSVIGEANANTIGGYSDPEWSGVFDFIWTTDHTRVFWRMLWQDDALLDPGGNVQFEDLNGNEIFETDGRFISNVSIAYSFGSFFASAPDTTIVQLSINNLFDRDPDLIQEAIGHFGTAELLGRTYSLSLRGRW
jgi:outer membrane receptor protein involved in Fe transport